MKHLNPKTGRMVSRQRMWQIENRARGLCISCAKPSHTHRCPECHERHIARQRERMGQQAWRPGSPARPPLRTKQLTLALA